MAHKNGARGRYPSDDDPSWSHLSENAKGTPTYRELLEERFRLRAKQKSEERFVRLGNDLTDSPAWRALGSHARDAYAWLERRYKGKNNGKIPMSVRELAKQMSVNDKTANKALKRLQAFGFIAVHQKGHMGLRGDEQRRATRWRLTEHRCGDNPATRDYIDVDIDEAERRCNIKNLRTNTRSDTCHFEGRTRTSEGDAEKMPGSSTEEKNGDQVACRTTYKGLYVSRRGTVYS